MGPESPPKCVECKTTESLLWRSVEEQGQICQTCYERKRAAEEQHKEEEAKMAKDKDAKDAREQKALAAEEKRLRKSTRATRFKSKTINSGGNSNIANSANDHPNGTGSTAAGSAGGGGGGGGGGKAQTKGRNRRNLFKKTPNRTPATQATPHVVESVFYKGSYLQVGDIVSLMDCHRNVYYAQIRGLLVDNFCEKSAYLTWLIPTQASPDPCLGFDAATYLIGPDEELSRKLSCLEFVIHAPSNYYLDRTTPFPLPDHMEYDKRRGGYIWTTLPEYVCGKTAR